MNAKVIKCNEKIEKAGLKFIREQVNLLARGVNIFVKGEGTDPDKLKDALSRVNDERKRRSLFAGNMESLRFLNKDTLTAGDDEDYYARKWIWNVLTGFTTNPDMAMQKLAENLEKLGVINTLTNDKIMGWLESDWQKHEQDEKLEKQKKSLFKTKKIKLPEKCDRPVSSRDGMYGVFNSASDKKLWYIYSEHGVPLSRIELPELCYEPIISDDGSIYVFQSRKDNGKDDAGPEDEGRFYLYSKTGEPLGNFSTGRQGWDPVFSPGGSYLVFIDSEGKKADKCVWIFNSTGTKIRQFNLPDNNTLDPVISPDGAYIVFQNKDDQQKYYVYDKRGKPVTMSDKLNEQSGTNKKNKVAGSQSPAEKIKKLGINFEVDGKTYVMGMQDDLYKAEVDIHENRFNSYRVLNTDGANEMTKSLKTIADKLNISYNKLALPTKEDIKNIITSYKSALSDRRISLIVTATNINDNTEGIPLQYLMREQLLDKPMIKFVYYDMRGKKWIPRMTPESINSSSFFFRVLE